MQLSARKVNRFLQHTGNNPRESWMRRNYGKELFLFLATLPPVDVRDKRIFIRITRKELGNRMHMDHYMLTSALDHLINANRLRKETGYDTVNVYVSFPANFLYDE